MLEARQLLTALREGTAGAEKERDELGTRFFLLGFSPNASRLSIRLWVEADAVELGRRLGWHLRDIAFRDWREKNERPLSVRRILQATGRAKAGPGGRVEFDVKAVSPLLAGDLARAVVTGGAYPQTWLGTMLRRIQADGDEAYIAEGIDPTSKKLPKAEAVAKRITDWICANFFDVRTFDAVRTTEVNAGQVRGPLQLAFSRSIDPVVTAEFAMTRCAVTNEKDVERSGRLGASSTSHTVSFAVMISSTPR